MTSLQESAADSKRQLEESLALYRDNNARLQDKLKLSSAEITRGNSIITKLQADTRALKGRLKLKAAVMLQQQQQTMQKNTELEASERGAAELRAQMAELRADKERAEEGCASCKHQLTEAQELLRSNQQVIQWLNKELNETQTGGRPYVSLPSRVTTFKPSLPPSMAAMSGKPAPHAPPLPPPSATANSGAGGATGASSLPAADAYAYASSSFKRAGATDPSSAAADADFASGYVPGQALASLRSRAGMALAEGVGVRSTPDSTNTTGGFSDYLSPSVSMAAST